MKKTVELRNQYSALWFILTIDLVSPACSEDEEEICEFLKITLTSDRSILPKNKIRSAVSFCSLAFQNLFAFLGYDIEDLGYDCIINEEEPSILFRTTDSFPRECYDFLVEAIGSLQRIQYHHWVVLETKPAFEEPDLSHLSRVLA